MIMNIRRIHRLLDHQWRLRDFRARQLTLAATAGIWILGALFTGYTAALAVAVLLLQTGWIEALRFRRAGTTFQTRRVLWIGATPHDERHRYLLEGWTP